MGNRDKARAALYVMVGGYLLYTAYKLFSTRSGTEGSEATVMLAFAIFFLIVGIAVLGFAFYMSRKSFSQNADITDNNANTLEDKTDSLEQKADISKESDDTIDIGGE